MKYEKTDKDDEKNHFIDIFNAYPTLSNNTFLLAKNLKEKFSRGDKKPCSKMPIKMTNYK